MNQRTHAWIAIRAVALLDDAGDAPDLVKLLKPHVKSTAIGAWIPDLQDSRRGFGDVDNHVMKMQPWKGERFVVQKKALTKQLGADRAMTAFINDRGPDDDWWAQPYRADPPPGQHLANRAMALTTTIVDLLILGDPSLSKLVPGTVRFAKELDPEARSTQEMAATYFFMLSHFVADSCMPCHCDARKLSAYGNGLHKQLEGHWSGLVGPFFDKAKLEKTDASSAKILEQARQVDEDFGIELDGQVPKLRSRDAWSELLYVCRGSFAVACTLAPPKKYGYKSQKPAPMDTVFAGADGQELLSALDAMIAHDAVLNTAMIWKDAWETLGPG